jgi:hypothetical protein
VKCRRRVEIREDQAVNCDWGSGCLSEVGLKQMMQMCLELLRTRAKINSHFSLD